MRWRRALATVAVLAATGSALTVAPQPAHAALPPHPIDDPVIYWNDVLLEVIRREGGGPGPIARAAAMMNAAIYDAESSYRATRKGGITSAPYISAPKYFPFPEGPDEEEHILGRTAYKILLNLYKGQASFLGLKFRERFGTAPPS
ncbi:vanadium-dependent haloperoxidase, partial [Streptomyces sp. URMC 123]